LVLSFDLCSELFRTRQHEIAQFAEEFQSQLCGIAQVVAKPTVWEVWGAALAWSFSQFREFKYKYKYKNKYENKREGHREGRDTGTQRQSARNKGS
jgi:hypothetical protein